MKVLTYYKYVVIITNEMRLTVNTFTFYTYQDMGHPYYNNHIKIYYYLKKSLIPKNNLK